jgi:undecaprenyl-diphosphatase|tara:strand:+ start:6123 stop:6953 length:831 start_codon:yes stop_codon:yes gene_type:complete
MLEAIFLGILQGLTEFLPISSSGHIRIAGALFGTNQDPGATFTAITQIGTELAVLLYFRNDIARIARAWFRKLAKKPLHDEESQDAKMGWLIILGTFPIVIVGYLGQDVIREDFRSLWLVAFTLIAFGLILGAADKFGKMERDLHQLTRFHGVLYGIAQTLALIPGVSRSGATIAMGRFLGYKREAALRYSFLLALPAVFGSGLYELNGAVSDGSAGDLFSIPETLVATFFAFVIGYSVISWLVKFVTTRSFAPFIIYRIALGSVLIILLSTGVIS